MGFLASVVLLRVGLLHMGARYLICFLIAYVVFLVLLRLWASRLDPGADSALDLPISDDAADSSVAQMEAGGGEFGGGGASGPWPEADPGGIDGPASAASSVESSISVGDAASLDLDEGWAIALPLAVLLGGLLAIGSVIYAAPVLLAEVVLDVAIAGGAYRRTLKLEPQYWAVGAFKRTWIAALVLATLLLLLGTSLQAMSPDAHTVGAALGLS